MRKKNHSNKPKLTFKQWVIKGFTPWTIAFIVINIVIYLILFLSIAFWQKPSTYTDPNTHQTVTISNNKSIPNALTAANIVIFVINVISLMFRSGFLSGAEKLLKNVGSTFNFKKQNEMQKVRRMSQGELQRYYDKRQKENELKKAELAAKKDKIHGHRDYKSTSFVFVLLIIIVTIAQLALIPFMI